ncbi:alpha/beta hydrolase [Nostocoides sp.]
MPVRRRAARGGAVVATLALLLTGCSIPNPFDRRESSSSTTSSAALPSGQEALATFYRQQLAWTDCDSAKCAKLTVPLDYAKPDGATIELSVLKVAARSSRKRIGSLLVNPGGPGGSGVEYARYADFVVGAPVRDTYDVVGFDPRGVGDSDPVECLTPPEMDHYLGSDPTPDDAAEEQQSVTTAKDFGAACKTNASPLAEHVSTVEVAKDMDILRAAVGDAKLNYLGKSYGTFLGATYAGLFPANVGRMVLDGVLAPDLTPEEVLIGQAKGFEVATRAWAADCVQEGQCPVGSSVAQVMTGLGELFDKLDATPAPVTGDARVKQLTEGWAAYGLAQAMYDQGLWASLTSALKALVNQNDGTALMGLADSYAERNVDGTYSGNMLQVFNAVNCLDSPDSPDIAVHRARAEKAEKEAPLFGRFIGWSGLMCGNWPIPATGKPHKIAAAGAAPIVVVGTTRDPATPYEWATRLAEQLDSGVLVTYDGDGHTAYTRSNACIDDALDDFYVKGTVPQDGLRC